MPAREAFATELSNLGRRWRNRLNERLKHTGLTQARWSTLLLLSRAGGRVTQRELAELAAIEGPTLVRLLDALESQGLVERLPVADDRRAKHIRLTPSAKSLLEDINRIAADLRQEVLEGVQPADLETCLRVMRQIRERLEKRT